MLDSYVLTRKIPSNHLLSLESRLQLTLKVRTDSAFVLLSEMEFEVSNSTLFCTDPGDFHIHHDNESEIKVTYSLSPYKLSAESSFLSQCVGERESHDDTRRQTNWVCLLEDRSLEIRDLPINGNFCRRVCIDYTEMEGTDIEIVDGRVVTHADQGGDS